MRALATLRRLPAHHRVFYFERLGGLGNDLMQRAGRLLVPVDFRARVGERRGEIAQLLALLLGDVELRASR